MTNDPMIDDMAMPAKITSSLPISERDERRESYGTCICILLVSLVQGSLSEAELGCTEWANLDYLEHFFVTPVLYSPPYRAPLALYILTSSVSPLYDDTFSMEFLSPRSLLADRRLP